MEKNGREEKTERTGKSEGARFFVGFYHYGVILTYLSVISGVVGIALSVSVNSFWGVVCLLISGLCDGFDGSVASTRKNRTAADKSFGSQIDSLSDLVAFGVEPVFIGFGMGLREWYYWPLFSVFVLCALIRLAYYNVTEETRTAEKRAFFEGLPVTNVAVALPVFYLFASMFTEISPLALKLIMVGAYALIAFLFVFRFRMPKAGVRGLLIAIAAAIVLIVSLALIKVYVFGLPLITGPVGFVRGEIL